MKKVVGSIAMGIGGISMFGILLGGEFTMVIAGGIILGLGKKLRKSGKFDSIPKIVKKKGYINNEDLSIFIKVDNDYEFRKALKNRGLKADLLITKNKYVIDNKLVNDMIRSVNKEIDQYGMTMASRASNQTNIPMEVISEIIDNTPSFSAYKKYSLNGDILIATGDYINNINVMLASRIYDIVQRNRSLTKEEIMIGVLPSSIEKFLFDDSLEYLRVNGLVNINLRENTKGENRAKESVYTANLLEEGKSMVQVLDMLRNKRTVDEEFRN